MEAQQVEGAALPWASSHEQQGPAQQQQQQGQEEVLHPDLPASSGLPLGARVEVKWEVTNEETQEATTKWWGAELLRCVDGLTDGEGRQVYVLRYDPDPEQGFEEHEECEVTFLEEHYLYDLGMDDELPWRRAGDAWEAPASEEGREVGPEGPIYTIGEIAAEIRRGERLRGRTIDEETTDALAELPQQQRMVIAAGFRAFQDHVTAYLKKLVEENGRDYVVTEADSLAAVAAAKAAVQSGM